MRAILGAVAILVCLGSGPASAAPLLWTLQNVTFGECSLFQQSCDPGGTVTGFFIFDAATRTFPDWTLTAEGGSRFFPPFSYVPQNSVATIEYRGTPDEFVNFRGPISPTFGQAREFRLAFIAPLTDAGGTVAINLANGWVEECYNCEPRRRLASGSVTTVVSGNAIPEPASVLLLCTGLIGLRPWRSWARRLRTQDSRLASPHSFRRESAYRRRRS